MNTLDENVKEGMFALFKGASGAGKSVAALSFPGLFVFDYDFKMPAIARKHFPKKSIEYETFKSTDRVSDLIREWLKCPVCGYANICDPATGGCGSSCPFESILHDSLTNMENLVMASVDKVKGESIPDKIKTVLQSKGKNKVLDLMDWDHYKTEMRFTDWLLTTSKMLRDRKGFPNNIIFNAHVMTVEQKNMQTGIVTKTRSIVTQGKAVAAYIPTQFDEVYMFGYEVKGLGTPDDPTKIHRICITQPEGEDEAKTAYSLSKYIDFTDGNFYEILQQQIAGQKWSASL